MRDTHKFLTVYLVLCCLALTSFLGLDYIAWKKQEKSFVFSFFSKKKKISETQKNLIHIVDQMLVSTQIPEKGINKYTDKQGICHIMVSLDREKYSLLEKNLEESFFNINATIQKKREQQKKEKKYLLWEVKKKGEIPLFLLFSIEPEKEKKPELFYAPKNSAALIIDDMGYSMDNIKDLCSMKKALTIAVLPYSPYAEETANLAHHNGLEVILHLPLESMNNIYDNEHTLGLINSRMDQKEILEVLNANLKMVPFISGVNTHMGSKVTKDKMIMGIILENIKESHLYFIDSRTTPYSVAYDIAQKMKIPSAYRHIFLDSETEPEYIKNQLIKLFKTAEKNGKAVGICHPFPETLQVLKENIHQADRYNVSLVFASQIVH
ncbi:MAG: divergent polysaccharide deacetylase family protein [Candidatus Aminicenantes bacterium]